jgi:N-acetyl-alpha-D-glucosaminyl L-malate synthase BshA
MRPLRIGVVCFSTLGGSGIVATEVGARLAQRGHSVSFFARDVPRRLDLCAPRVSLRRVAAAAPPPGDESAYPFALAAALVDAAREGLDVVHAHYALPNAASAVVARTILRGRGEPVPRLVTTLHGTDVTTLGVDPAWREVVRHTAFESDALTVPSRWLRDQVVQHLGVDPARVAVIPNFVDTEAYLPRPGDLRHLFPDLPGWGATTSRPRILFHGSNFRALKRVGDIVRALSLVVREHNVGLVLVGDGPERPAVQALIDELGLAPRVRLLGPLLHFEDLLARADLFLLPSETESFGLAALEALASGVPVVASAVGGVGEVVDHGETGLLVPPGEPGALATAVESLLGDEPRRLTMCLAARKAALSRFTPDPALDQYERILAGAT